MLYAGKKQSNVVNTMKKTLLVYIFSLNILFSYTAYAENSIAAFDEDWAVNLLLNYKSCVFENSLDSVEYLGERPWDIGLGLRYKNTSAQLSVPLFWGEPFKNWSYDFEIDSYFDKIYYEAYFKHYPNLIIQDTDKQNKLDIYSSGIMATFIHNNENHSLSSVVKLDKKQEISSGSLLYGFGLFHSSLYSTTKKIDRYSDRQHFLYFGPSIGYSYTWVFDSGMFLNLNCVAFVNPAININTGKWLCIPQVEPKIVIGHHNAAWSINLNMMNNSAFMIYDKKDIDTLLMVSVKIMFSQRL